MSQSSDGLTIDLNPPDTAPTLTQAGGSTTVREAPSGFAPLGFEIISELGRGGMGVVYKARQKSLNRLVALKVILGAGHAGADQLARFRAEATTAAQLQHPNIVQVFEVGEHDGQPFFSLELVEGGSLAERLKGEPQPPRDAADLVRTLAIAVQHAHERGVVHRDLKPANVLMGSRFQVPSSRLKEDDSNLEPGTWNMELKITDFGLAKQQSSSSHLTQSGAILGTPSYMAPEQAAGRGNEVGPAADVYALGAILYECLTGRPPFRAAAVMDTVLQVLNDDPLPPSRLQPKLPRDLETICLKCLAKKPEQRYSSAAALADDLGRFVNGESILARPASPTGKALKWARRHPARATAVFVLAVPLPILLGFMVYLWAEARSAKATIELEKAAVDREHERSQAYLKSALGTMDRILDRVGDERLARIPALQEERAAILADAVAFYETLLRLDSTEPTVRFETAQTYTRVARLGLLAGQTPQSAAAGRNGIDLLTPLIREYPDRPEYRNELARAYMLFGHSQVLSGDFDAGVAAYEKGAELAEALIRDHPNEPDYRSTAAECRRSLGYFFSQKQSTDAEGYFKSALRHAESVYAERPQPADRALLAGVLGAYGQFLVGQRRFADAERILQQGMALVDTKTFDTPPTGQARTNHEQAVVTLRYATAILYVNTKRVDKVGPIMLEVLDHFEGMLAGQPRSFPNRLQAIGAYLFQTQLLNRQKKHTEALKTSSRARELVDSIFRDFQTLCDAPNGIWLRVMRQNALEAYAASLVHAGKHTEARAALQDLDPNGPNWSGASAYNVGCLFALLTADGPQKEEHAATAMTWLKKAATTGYPATQAEVDHVTTKDDDLAALRPRPEFQEWVKTLKATKK
jgi:eukaryotic-like serine/threonine-protein kinase